MLAERALEGSLEFTVRPTLPLYLPGEPPQLEILGTLQFPPAGGADGEDKTYPDGQPLGASTTSVTLPAAGPVA